MAQEPVEVEVDTQTGKKVRTFGEAEKTRNEFARPQLRRFSPDGRYLLSVINGMYARADAPAVFKNTDLPLDLVAKLFTALTGGWLQQL